MRQAASSLLAIALGFGLLSAQDTALDTIHRIKTEAFDNSKVMRHLAYISDRYGPRLTGSPEFNEAAEWAMARLREYGVANVHEEKWGPFGRSWSIESYSVEMTAPRYSHLVAAPLAWSEPTKGPESGDVLFAPYLSGNIFDIKKNKDAFERYRQQWHGKLKGKIVLVSEISQPKPVTRPIFRRYTDAELAEIAKAPEPAVRRNVPIDEVKVPDDPEEAGKYFQSLSSATMDQLIDEYFKLIEQQGKFFHDEGVMAVIRADNRAHEGLIFVEQAGSHKSSEAMAPASFIVTEEQYSRMTRLLEDKQPVAMRVNLAAKISQNDVDGQNIVGEIPGQKKPDEVVMIGAHFDSWHSGTGANDNGAGSAVMIEVMRILKALDLKMDRTVRIGLWSGEEEGLYGSKAYVQAHFADPKTMQLKPEHAKLDAYLNLDNGSGRIRGIYLEGNDAARPAFEHFMQPFRDLGVTTTTLKSTGGTDHLSFDAVGLPGFQFIQDPLDYGTVVHHSDIDTYSHAVPEDLMQASAVIAALAYEIANRETSIPRKPLPKPSASKGQP